MNRDDNPLKIRESDDLTIATIAYFRGYEDGYDRGEQQWGRDQLMAVAAVRYCLGRSTYIVKACADWIIFMWPEFTQSTQTLIQKDIDEAFKRDDRAREEGSEYLPLGMDMDRREWERVRNLWSEKKLPT